MNFIIVVMCLWHLAVIVHGNNVKRFGPGNGFMCHCKDSNEQCDKQSGQCTSGCATDWFGPGCQYRDLAQMRDTEVSQSSGYSGTDAIQAVDGDETTCSRTRTQFNPQWKIKLPHNETITELYIQTTKHYLRHFANIRVSIEYNKTNNQVLSELCFSDDNGPPQNESFKIKCVAPMTGNQVRIELGQQGRLAILALCDIRINGGRNLAFDKPTSQSSNLFDIDINSSSNAVDGDVKTCSWTKWSGVSYWRLNLGHDALLQHIKLTTYPGYESVYQAQLFDGSNTTVHTWEDKTGHSPHAVNEVATSIEIRPKNGYGSVIMCEVELFGDCTDNYCGFDCKTECHCNDMSIWDRMADICSSDQRKDDDNTCDDGTYGSSCHTCGNCLNNEPCDKDTGVCHNGCQIGYSGKLCKGCSVGTYGNKCGSTCSKNCKRDICSNTDGRCIYGCNDGWQGGECTNACPYPKYGNKCTGTCSSHCKDNKCNHIDGQCEKGCNSGWQGDMCQYPCKDGTYGDQCSGSCSKYCKKCNKVTGQCIGGCEDGWRGDTCKHECTDGTYGNQCMGSCSEHCKMYSCNKVTGHCIGGCKDGRQGDTCEEDVISKTKPKCEDAGPVYVKETRTPKDQNEDTMTSRQNDQNYEEIGTANIDDRTYETVDI